MSIITEDKPATTIPGAPPDFVPLRRRTIDSVLIGIGAVMTLAFVVAGSLLTWGSNFSADYVDRELSSQNITFPDAATLQEEGRTDLVKYAGQDLNTGQEAEAYASYINGHLQNIAGGQTYADLGGPERAAKAAVQEAKDSGASEAEVADLQATASGLTAQRDTMFKGETLRGLLLSAYAWATVGQIAGYAAIATFVAAAVMFVLVLFGLRHHHKVVQVS